VEALARVGAGQRARGRLKEDARVVVAAHRTEHALTREALSRGVMHAELGGDLGDGQPPSTAKMLGKTRNLVGGAPNIS
jgi:hypothetical protein